MVADVLAAARCYCCSIDGDIMVPCAGCQLSVPTPSSHMVTGDWRQLVRLHIELCMSCVLQLLETIVSHPLTIFKHYSGLLNIPTPLAQSPVNSFLQIYSACQ